MRLVCGGVRRVTLVGCSLLGVGEPPPGGVQRGWAGDDPGGTHATALPAGIGAAGDSNDDWTYLGEGEPNRFPGPTPGWSKGEFATAISLDS